MSELTFEQMLEESLKKITVYMCVVLQALQLSMLGVKHAIACSTFNPDFTIVSCLHKP